MDQCTLYNLSLCSGGGGLDLGLALALGELRTVCYVEWEAFALNYLAEAMEAGRLAQAPMWTDLRTFNGLQWRGVVDCVTAGYPCQPFSLAGKRHGSDDPRHLWPQIRRIVSEVEPAIVFLENVPGHLNLGFNEVACELEDLGYQVAAGLFTAEEVGATHKRERLFIVADAGGKLSDRIHVRCKERYLEADTKRVCPRIPTSITCRQGCPTQEQDRTAVGCPLFPPRPDDLDAWKQVLEADPSLEPALCGVVDGVAQYRHQCRLLGNGVVPLQAAYAFISLWSSVHSSGE